MIQELTLQEPPPAAPRTTFHDFLRRHLAEDAFTADEVVAAIVALIRGVVRTHEAGQVAPLRGLDHLWVDGLHVRFDDAERLEPRLALETLRRFERPNDVPLDVVAEVRRVDRLDTGEVEEHDLRIARPGEELTRPAYLVGYRSWEHQIGHHDALTDVFSLGLILASLACGLDLEERRDLEALVRSRSNLFALSDRLHPVLAQAIVQMTELDRHRRAQDLPGLLHRIEHYREIDVDVEFDVSQIEGFRQRDRTGRRRAVLDKLEERLYEISRRNPLLYFKPRASTLNLTLASVPLSFNPEAVDPERLLAWWPWLQKKLAAGETLVLDSYLRFEDATYAPATLDKIRLEAGRDQRELGFSNLRLVVAFLRWHNFKDEAAREERIDSPLVLLPVGLRKKRGVRDRYFLEPAGPVAEINPVLRHQLKQLYAIELPEGLDLETTDLGQFFAFLRDQIKASEPGVALRYVDRPRVKMIHGQARRRLDQHLRRQRRLGLQRLGLQSLGLQRLGPGEPPAVRAMPDPVEAGAVAVETAPPPIRERKLAAFLEGGETHPMLWEFDLCSLTLGNFRYRRMSLVRDYNALIDDDRANDVFDSIFSVAPCDELEPAEPLGLGERFPVLPCDPTQASAIDVARRGSSYIIQGPPGTGKSQTIANLIADFVAQGKRVLFVCQKRAALDVVYLRLKKLGLDELCCLVHDAQADKKAVIHDLRHTYERFLERLEEPADAVQRDASLHELRRTLEPLERFDRAMRSAESSGIATWQLLARLVELFGERPELDRADKESLPRYQDWVAHRRRLDRLRERVAELGTDGVFARHPLAVLHPRFAECERPCQRISEGLDRAAKLGRRLMGVVAELPVDEEATSTPQRIRELIDYAEEVEPFARRGLLALAEPTSEASRSFENDRRRYRKRADAYKDARRHNEPWIHRLSRGDLESALEQAEVLDRQWLPAWRPAWWRLRKVLEKSYDWTARQVRPSWRSVLFHLLDEYQAEDALRELEDDLASTYGWDDVSQLGTRVAELRSWIEALGGGARRLHHGVLNSPERRRDEHRLAELPRFAELARDLEVALDDLLGSPEQVELRRLDELLASIEGALEDLDDVIPCWNLLRELPQEIAAAIRRRSWTLDQLEAALAEASLDDAYRGERSVVRFNARQREQSLDRVAGLVEDLYRSNARHVKQAVRAGFRRRADLAQVPAAALADDEAEVKRSYGKGRRELEHEFGKRVRFKSIRDLWSGPAGQVMRDLKPVWLMSPFSISDTLPLTDDDFDVVIFDEASQIPVEEAVPALYRGRQAIVVGDEMQLPPTSFFAGRSPADELLVIDDEGEEVEYDLSPNSFLNQAAKRLPSTFLGWHYRSRSEALISFSNAAFYNGRLLTVPEEELVRPCEEIRVTDPEEGGAAGVDALLGRSVSFHFVENGVYEKRRNAREAEYVAELVAQLIGRRTGLSLGVVAFSQAQQDEIETALERRARRDPRFRKRLEAEYEREVDGELAGLLVKNLENVQGDERDVVILSVCYGPAPDGRVRMSFGPINQGGGEKRLNVAFSRAKHHMVVVSSMRSSEITNVYNDGANSLRNYLRYAEAVSTGDAETMQAVLDELAVAHHPSVRERSARGRSTASHPVVDGLAAELEARGFRVDRRVGQSVFRCDLAIYRPGDPTYRLGVLVDTAEHYRQADLLERDLMKPRLLRDFGWRVCAVLTKDWYHDRDQVVEGILELVEEPSPYDERPKPVTT